MFRVIKGLLILFFVFVCLCGFSKRTKEKPFIMFASDEVTLTNLASTKTTFEKGDDIHYLVYVPKGFQDDFVRIQVLKKDTKTDFSGYKVKYTYDTEVTPKSSTLAGKLTVYEEGLFVMQIVEFAHPAKAVSVGAFKVE